MMSTNQDFVQLPGVDIKQNCENTSCGYADWHNASTLQGLDA